MSNDTFALPKDDFADVQFDHDAATTPHTLLLLLSTPRSGSTLACNILHLAGICIAHEYFQPYQIRPTMAHRWGLEEDDDEAYCSNLARWRTSSLGVLGVNLHAHHLKYFERARHFLPDSIQRVRYVWISRQDKVAQAVSYEIASQTKQWSSAFKKKLEPNYDYRRILRRLRFLQTSDMTIRLYLWRRGHFQPPIFYENFASDHDIVLKAAGRDERVAGGPTLRQQAGLVNAEMIARFRHDYSPWHGRGSVQQRLFTLLRLTGER